jgi:hypothetical protein
MEEMKVWTLFAPLGELPDDGALGEVAESLREEERYHRTRTLPLAAQEPTEWLKRFLEEVKGSEGILASQVDGGGVAWRYAKFYGPVVTSVLAVAAVHAERSAYVLVYDRTPTDRWGRPPRLARLARAMLHDNPETREEVEALEERLFRRYPALEEALRPLEERPFFADAERRGQVLFPITSMGEVPYALVGSRLLPLYYAYRGRRLREVKDDTLVKLLRERTLLRTLPPRVVRALLRGEGDPERALEEAARRANLAHLASL